MGLGQQVQDANGDREVGEVLLELKATNHVQEVGRGGEVGGLLEELVQAFVGCGVDDLAEGGDLQQPHQLVDTHI